MPSHKKQNTRLLPQRLLLWFLLAVLVVVISIWAVAMRYTVEKYWEPVQFDSIHTLVYAPKYLSPNEDEEIRLAFDNFSIKPVTVTFGLANSSSITGFLGLESNIIYSGTIASRQQINRQARVFFYMEPARFGQVAPHIPRLRLWASTDNSPIEERELEIYLAPLPLARSLSYSLGGILSGLGIFLFREMWNESKKTVRKALFWEIKRVELLLRYLWKQVRKLVRKKR